MNRSTFVIPIAVVAFALAGCVAETPSARPDDRDSSSSSLDNSIPCNLWERYDAEAAVVRARYDQPAGADYVHEHYGDWVANHSCSDAQVFAWQELRRDAGERDEICRVVYDFDTLTGLVRLIGCAVPVMVVTDAAH